MENLKKVLVLFCGGTIVMRKIIVLFIVILLFSFNSCSDSIPELWGEQKDESQKDSDNYFESIEKYFPKRNLHQSTKTYQSSDCVSLSAPVIYNLSSQTGVISLSVQDTIAIQQITITNIHTYHYFDGYLKHTSTSIQMDENINAPAIQQLEIDVNIDDKELYLNSEKEITCQVEIAYIKKGANKIMFYKTSAIIDVVN